VANARSYKEPSCQPSLSPIVRAVQVSTRSGRSISAIAKVLSGVGEIPAGGRHDRVDVAVEDRESLTGISHRDGVIADDVSDSRAIGRGSTVPRASA